MAQSRGSLLTSWIAQLVIAGVLAMASFSKLSGSEASVALFDALGVGAGARLGVGIAEAFAVVLILVPQTVTIGALLALGVVTGAIVTHLVKLGIVIRGVHPDIDGATMFVMAVVVFVASLVVLTIRRAEIPLIGKGGGGTPVTG